MPLQEVTEKILKDRTLNIGVGTRLQTQFGKKGNELKTVGALVGVVSDECLLIRVPTIPGILEKLHEGSPIVVRYVYAGNVYGFTSTIMAYTRKPTLIVFIKYPTSIESMNLRQTQRLDCLLPATVKIGMNIYKGVILDISINGCRIYIEYATGDSPPVDINRTVEISFHLTGMAEEQAINGIIQNLRKNSKLAEMGLQFDKDNESVLNNVKLYMSSFSELRYLPLVKPPSEHEYPENK